MMASFNYESTDESPFNWMFVAVCAIPIFMTIHSLYIILLIGVMGKDGPLYKRQINFLLLVDEILRLLGSVGALVAATLATIGEEVKV